jgi:hypothetical protein
MADKVRRQAGDATSANPWEVDAASEEHGPLVAHLLMHQPEWPLRIGGVQGKSAALMPNAATDNEPRKLTE